MGIREDRWRLLRAKLIEKRAEAGDGIRMPLSQADLEELIQALGYAIYYRPMAEREGDLRRRVEAAADAHRKTKGAGKHRAATDILGIGGQKKHPDQMTDVYLMLADLDQPGSGPSTVTLPAAITEGIDSFRSSQSDKPRPRSGWVGEGPEPLVPFIHKLKHVAGGRFTMTEAVIITGRIFDLKPEASRSELGKQRLRRRNAGQPGDYALPQWRTDPTV